MTDPQEIHRALIHALDCSMEWARGENEFSNSLRSARFLSDACDALNRCVNPDNHLCLRRVRVDKKGKHPGEWLLDGIWTEDTKDISLSNRTGIPIRVHCALECESSTNGDELSRDLAKLIVIRSGIKIFASGLNQKTPEGANGYVHRRVSEIGNLLNLADSGEKETEWYLAFWPSPLSIERESLWKHLDRGRYSHLSSIRLYRRVGGLFQKVEAPGK